MSCFVASSSIVLTFCFKQRISGHPSTTFLCNPLLGLHGLYILHFVQPPAEDFALEMHQTKPCQVYHVGKDWLNHHFSLCTGHCPASSPLKQGSAFCSSEQAILLTNFLHLLSRLFLVLVDTRHLSQFAWNAARKSAVSSILLVAAAFLNSHAQPDIYYSP